MHNETHPLGVTEPLQDQSAPQPTAPRPAHQVCANCKNFDLAEGQAVIKQFPAFMQVAGLISPAQIGRKVVRDFERDCRLCNGKGQVLLGGRSDLVACVGCGGTGKIQDQELSAPGAPMKATWAECGACLKDSVVVWGGDKKECWESTDS